MQNVVNLRPSKFSLPVVETNRLLFSALSLRYSTLAIQPSQFILRYSAFVIQPSSKIETKSNLFCLR